MSDWRAEYEYLCGLYHRELNSHTATMTLALRAVEIAFQFLNAHPQAIREEARELGLVAELQAIRDKYAGGSACEPETPSSQEDASHRESNRSASNVSRCEKQGTVRRGAHNEEARDTHEARTERIEDVERRLE